MRWSTRHLSLFAASLLVATACEDTAGPPLQSVQDLDVVVPDLGSSIPASLPRPVEGDAPAIGDTDELPDGFERPAGILRSRLDAGFSGRRAYAAAMMQFWGNRGLQEVDLSLYYDGDRIASRTAKGRKTELLPGVYRIDTNAAVTVNGDCGHTVDASSAHEAWHAYGEMQWDTDTQQNHDDDDQPACDAVIQKPRTESGGRDDEDSDWYICYYTDYYDSRTGRYLGSAFHGCEPL